MGKWLQPPNGESTARCTYMRQSDQEVCTEGLAGDSGGEKKRLALMSMGDKTTCRKNSVRIETTGIKGKQVKTSPRSPNNKRR